MHKILLNLLITYSILNPIFSQSTSNKRAKELRGALRPERTCFDVYYYNLFLKIKPDQKSIEGLNKIHFITTDTTSKIQIDLFENLNISSIKFKNQLIKFTREYDAVWVYFPIQLQKNDTTLIEVFYDGKPKSNFGDFGRHGFHWDIFDKKPLVGVSCEQVGASLWWPNKDHLSDEPDSMRMHWIVPENVACISNGILENVTKSNRNIGFLTYNWFVKNAINNYNVTVYLGNYKQFTHEYRSSVTGKIHELNYYYYSLDDKEALNYFAPVSQFLGFFEEIYGEYPYWNEKFAVVESNYSGMEHQTCLAIGSDLLNYKNWYYGVGVNFHSTLIHEIAHEWWGNSVSVADMADAWMNEGFATYSEMLFIEKLLGKNYYHKMIQFLKYRQTNHALVGKRDINDDIISKGNIYMNGAIFLDKLRGNINDDVIFFDILKTFQSKYKNKVITTKDFLEMVNLKTSKDFTALFTREVF
jgi:aminopeptidase N